VKEGSLSTSRGRGFQYLHQWALWLRRCPSTYWTTLGRESWTGTPWGGVGRGFGLVSGNTTLSVRVQANINSVLKNKKCENENVSSTTGKKHLPLTKRNGCAHPRQSSTLACIVAGRGCQNARRPSATLSCGRRCLAGFTPAAVSYALKRNLRASCHSSHFPETWRARQRAGCQNG